MWKIRDAAALGQAFTATSFLGGLFLLAGGSLAALFPCLNVVACVANKLEVFHLTEEPRDKPRQILCAVEASARDLVVNLYVLAFTPLVASGT